MGGERVVVRYKEKASRLVLHAHEIAQRAEVITQVQSAGRPYAA
jgi:hypothetical protein